MALIHEQLPLRTASSSDWLGAVESDFDRFLADHASCERKAAALAMSFIGKFPSRKALVEPMICLAREELAHYLEVFRLMEKRAVSLIADEKDPYVQGLLRMVRHGDEDYFLDRLLVSGVIEARACERLLLLGQNLKDAGLAKFYQRLGREEAGHYMIFVRLARVYFAEEIIRSRLDEILDAEAEIMMSLPIRPAIH
ncbi:MAG: tRNA-(ms[2]io[6]A)-hydroxylase [Oligoflexus sp.]